MPTDEQFHDKLRTALRSYADDFTVPANLLDTVVINHKKYLRRRIRVIAISSGATVLAVIMAVVTLPGTTIPRPSARAAIRPTSAVVAALDSVAKVAANAPAGLTPGPGQYLYIETQELSTSQQNLENLGAAPPKAYATYQKVTEDQEWISPQGGGRQLETPASVTFLTPADQQAWEWAQSTPTIQKDQQVWRENGNTTTGTQELLGAPREWTYPASSPKCAPNCLGLPYPNIADLPTDPSALDQAIVQQYEHHHASNGLTLQLAGGLLQEAASPQLRRALYEMVEQIPGVTNLGSITDSLGRTGEAVGYTEYGSQFQLIFDPTTSAVLEVRVVRVVPETGPTSLPIGTVVRYTTYVATGIASSTSQVPQASRQTGNTGNSGSIKS